MDGLVELITVIVVFVSFGMILGILSFIHKKEIQKAIKEENRRTKDQISGIIQNTRMAEDIQAHIINSIYRI